MSSGAAIAAVTAALRQLLSDAVAADPDLTDTIVTMQAPDIARADGRTSNQLNLFLFRTAVNAAWSNQPVPGRVRPGEEAPPPLPLTLSYLITAYGRENDAQRPFSHLLLGHAMCMLHTNPFLTPEALRTWLPEPEAPQFLERVRLTLQPMNLEDISKLWSGLQTHLRLSTAYEASVVLIENRRGIRAALPVMRRGPADSGVVAQPDMAPPVPTLSDVAPGAATLGAVVTLRGVHLSDDHVTVMLRRAGKTWDLQPAPGGTGSEIRVPLPTDKEIPAGVFAVTVATGPPERPIGSNALALAIMPRIVSPLPMTARRRNGRIQVALEVSPPVQPEQSVALLLGSREIPLPPRKQETSRLELTVPQIEPGVYVLRVRVDGVDSPVVHTAADGHPAFDPQARLTVTS
jgi:hypothetical protein